MDTRQAQPRKRIHGRHGQIQSGSIDGLADPALQRRSHQQRNGTCYDRSRAVFEVKAHKEANERLQNWGRYVHDGWLHDTLLYTPPPTSEGYLAPLVAYDEPEPAVMPVDELDAQKTEDVVVFLGLRHFDYYRVLVHWYPHLLIVRRETPHAECIKRLSKHMHCSFSSAERMLRDSVARFADMRQTAR